METVFVGDVTSDYLALRRDVAAVRLGRDVVRVFGPDSRTFLQGQLSQDLGSLSSGEATWSLLLEPQGKVVAWLRVWGRQLDDELLLDVDAGRGRAVIDRLNRFRLRTKCELELLDWQCVALRGPNCPDPDQVDVSAELRTAVAWPGLPGVDLLGPEVHVPEGVHLAGEHAFASVRIEAGWPTNRDELAPGEEPSVIPGEAGQWLVDASVSFTKGCYTGQELVARVDSRGNNTPRRLRGLVLGTNVLPPPGAAVLHDGVERGRVTSVGESLDLRAPVCLAFVHRSVEPPVEVELSWIAPNGEPATAPAQVRELPLIGP